MTRRLLLIPLLAIATLALIWFVVPRLTVAKNQVIPPDDLAAGQIAPSQVVLGLEEVARGFRAPLFVTHANDGSGRTFVVEKGGLIRRMSDGQTFLNITDRVNSRGSEQGLLGLAFHPRFRENGYLYVHYTERGGDTVIARFTAGGNRQTADPGSEKRILFQDDPAGNHNGGMLAFGPDGFLYIGLGDGGGANDTYGNGQNKQTFLGKILRIDVDRGDPYAIPASNPFVGNNQFKPEIWAYGLRNPWRFSFDRRTGNLYIGDVGQNRYEWVHFQTRGQGGQNYGWPILEGTHCLRGNSCDRTGLTLPVAEYSHDLGCTVTGGYVYRGTRQIALQGMYIYGDYCSGRIWGMVRDRNGRWITSQMLQSNASISSFGEDQAGEVYMTDLSKGIVYRITGRRR